MKNIIAMTTIILSLGIDAGAQANCEQRMMIPIVAHGVPGNYGSLWDTRLAITNHSATPVQVLGYGECSINPCVPPSPIQGQSTIFPGQYTQYLTVECARANDISVQLRIQDLSRQSETWGTSIPTVRESDLFDDESINVVDIPNSHEFRSMLRVYAFDARQDSDITISIFELDDKIDNIGIGDRLLVAFHRTITASTDPNLTPAVVEIPLWTVAELSGATRLRISITGQPGHGLWAFVSATNNATQHVTVLTPE